MSGINAVETVVFLALRYVALALRVVALALALEVVALALALEPGCGLGLGGCGLVNITG